MATTLEEELSSPCLDNVADYFILQWQDMEISVQVDPLEKE
jgi:hypothetical protein